MNIFINELCCFEIRKLPWSRLKSRGLLYVKGIENEGSSVQNRVRKAFA